MGNCSLLPLDATQSSLAAPSATARWLVDGQQLVTTTTLPGSVLSATQPLSAGEHNVTLILTNAFGKTANETRSFNVTDGAQPLLRLSAPQQAYRGGLLRASYSVDWAGCAQEALQAAQWTWTTPGETLPLSVPAEATQGRELALPMAETARLARGYLLRVQVCTNSSARCSSATAEVQIVQPPLRARIAGPSERSLPLNSSIVLDASSSTVGFPADQTSFAWTCSRCTLEKSDTNMTATVTADSAVGSSMLVTVTLTRGASSDSAQVSLLAVEAQAPQLTAVQLPSRVSVGRRTRLRFSVDWRDQPEGTLAWSVVDGSLVLDDSTLARAGGAAGAMLLLRADAMRVESSYTLRLTAQSSGGTTFADVLLAGNSAPQGGRLDISPSTGVGGVTFFTLAASSWVDDADDLPLSYLFRLVQRGGKQVSVRLAPVQLSNVLRSRLPAPQAVVAVRVADRYGAAAEVQSDSLSLTPRTIGAAALQQEASNVLQAAEQRQDPAGYANWLLSVAGEVVSACTASAAPRRCDVATDVLTHLLTAVAALPTEEQLAMRGSVLVALLQAEDAGLRLSEPQLSEALQSLPSLLSALAEQLAEEDAEQLAAAVSSSVPSVSTLNDSGSAEATMQRTLSALCTNLLQTADGGDTAVSLSAPLLQSDCLVATAAGRAALVNGSLQLPEELLQAGSGRLSVRRTQWALDPLAQQRPAVASDVVSLIATTANAVSSSNAAEDEDDDDDDAAAAVPLAVSALQQPVSFDMQLPDGVALETARCAYWDEQTSAWSTTGVVLSCACPEQRLLRCSSTHLTDFALWTARALPVATDISALPLRREVYSQESLPFVLPLAAVLCGVMLAAMLACLRDTNAAMREEELQRRFLRWGTMEPPAEAKLPLLRRWLQAMRMRHTFIALVVPDKQALVLLSRGERFLAQGCSWAIVVVLNALFIGPANVTLLRQATLSVMAALAGLPSGVLLPRLIIAARQLKSETVGRRTLTVRKKDGSKKVLQLHKLSSSVLMQLREVEATTWRSLASTRRTLRWLAYGVLLVVFVFASYISVEYVTRLPARRAAEWISSSLFAIVVSSFILQPLRVLVLLLLQDVAGGKMQAAAEDGSAELHMELAKI
eukprot:PLAT12507.3.p1 GENE.PLAT12507.3~~PLAT12507.3.p1  ORF type:complete len:1153 (+),score=559.47 PLAT12507.3:112-3459(+)